LALLLLGFFLRSTLIVPLFASLAFGATSVLLIGGAGGSSPLLFTIFAATFVIATLMRPRAVHDLMATMRAHWVPWVVLALSVYAAASAYIFPRLFFGDVAVFVPINGTVVEIALQPVTGNITQTAYLLIGVAAYFAFCIALRNPETLRKVGTGLFTFALLQAALGVVDWGGKIAGLGDILEPIRTASYSMLTEVTEGGFWRIVGGFAEASMYAAATVAALAYSFTYWRYTGARSALALSGVLFGLLVLSTSTTAYVALAIVALPMLFEMAAGLISGKLHRRDIEIATVAIVGLAAIGVLLLIEPRALENFGSLLWRMVFEKMSSESGMGRAYWNMKGLEAFNQTNWLGVGMGSSRASSWVVAVLSQLGVVGSALVVILIGFILFAPVERRAYPKDSVAIVRGARAAALASLVTASLGGASADPGLLFFTALAILSSPLGVAASGEVRSNERQSPPALASN
jgi:hypothetical protein